MKNIFKLMAVSLFIVFTACNNDDETSKILNLSDVKLKVSFNSLKSDAFLKNAVMTKETPDNYYIALKSATLIGQNGTANFNLFSVDSLKNCEVYDYADDNISYSLLDSTDIPDGDYSGINLEIYYLQMNIAIATTNRGVERRNFRIYLSDDAEFEGGEHQPGDMTQINSDVEIGWLLGEGQTPDMDPVSPRTAAYTTNGDGVHWYDFGGKPANNYGPFGDMTFMAAAPHPVYNTTVPFTFNDNGGSVLVVDFDVADCWQFEDKSGDGFFGPADLDPIDPTEWHMELPKMTVSLN